MDENQINTAFANERLSEGYVGRMTGPAIAVFPPHITIGQTIERLRNPIRTTFATYGFVTDETGRT